GADEKGPFFRPLVCQRAERRRQHRYHEHRGGVPPKPEPFREAFRTQVAGDDLNEIDAVRDGDDERREGGIGEIIHAPGPDLLRAGPLIRGRLHACAFRSRSLACRMESSKALWVRHPTTSLASASETGL